MKKCRDAGTFHWRDRKLEPKRDRTEYDARKGRAIGHLRTILAKKLGDDSRIDQNLRMGVVWVDNTRVAIWTVEAVGEDHLHNQNAASDGINLGFTGDSVWEEWHAAMSG